MQDKDLIQAQTTAYFVYCQLLLNKIIYFTVSMIFRHILHFKHKNQSTDTSYLHYILDCIYFHVSLNLRHTSNANCDP
jgi:hypothetical protein